MNRSSPYRDLTENSHRHRRREDLAGYEYSYAAEITNVYQLTRTEKLFQIQLIDPVLRKSFTFEPGQFVMLELPGIGEAPFSISSSPLRGGDIELCIRAVGNLTNFSTVLNEEFRLA